MGSGKHIKNPSRQIIRSSGARDAGYKGGASHHHTLRENLKRVTERFPLVNGHFGERGSSNDMRRIPSEDQLATAKDFYDRMTYGGIETSLEKGNGVKCKLADGSWITFRPVSRSEDKSPAVDINVRQSEDPCGIADKRIHFIGR